MVADLGRSDADFGTGFARSEGDSGGFTFSRPESDPSRSDDDSGAFGFPRTDTDRVSRPSDSDSGPFGGPTPTGATSGSRVPRASSGASRRQDADSGHFGLPSDPGRSDKGGFGRSDSGRGFSRTDNDSGPFSWPGTEPEETPAAEDTDPGDRFRPIRDADEPSRGSLRENLKPQAEPAAGPGEAFRSSAREALESYTREVQPPLGVARDRGARALPGASATA